MSELSLSGFKALGCDAAVVAFDSGEDNEEGTATKAAVSYGGKSPEAIMQLTMLAAMKVLEGLIEQHGRERMSQIVKHLAKTMGYPDEIMLGGQLREPVVKPVRSGELDHLRDHGLVKRIKLTSPI